MRTKTSQSIAEFRSDECLKFYPKNMTSPTSKYVCWMDVMGSKGIMVSSLNIASNFLMKLHMAALKASEEFSVELYPMIDGLYACSRSQSKMFKFINRVHSMLAVTFILQRTQLFKFKIRTGLAYGPVVRGTQVLKCADILQQHPLHTKAVLLGAALAQAYEAEQEAAPFGVSLDQSAVIELALSGKFSLSEHSLKWWRMGSRRNDHLLARELYRSLKQHYDWCLDNSQRIHYDKTRMNDHIEKINEYFADCEL